MRRGRPTADAAPGEVDGVILGADGLVDELRPRGSREVSDAAIGRLVVRAMNSGFAGSNHWSTRSMAKAPGLSRTTAARIRRAFALQMNRVGAFEQSREQRFVEAFQDVVGLGMNPPGRARMGFVGEKPQIRALYRTQSMLPMGRGKPERRTHD
jgi:hypothetical protein